MIGGEYPNSLYWVFYAREQPLDVEIEFGRLFFEDASCAIIEPISKPRAGAMGSQSCGGPVTRSVAYVPFDGFNLAY
jgi:hypothetical protein